jgi:transposase
MLIKQILLFLPGLGFLFGKAPDKYLLAYETKDQLHLVREKIVLYALAHGNRAAADRFECHRNTVSKWKSRYKQQGIEGLKDHSRAPHKRGDSANQLKIQYDLWPSNMALKRILYFGALETKLQLDGQAEIV